MALFRHQTPNYLALHTFTLNRAITSISLGALYQSRPVCRFAPMSVGKIRFACEGQMRVLQVFDVGLVDASSNVCLIKNKKDPQQLKRYPCND